MYFIEFICLIYMYSLYFNNSSFIYNKINLRKYKDFNKQYTYYTPYLGILDPDIIYEIPKNIFNESKLFFGKSKLIEINKNLFIQFEGNTKILPNKWYIESIKKVIQNYSNTFKTSQFPIYVQIIQNKIKSNMYYPYASYNAFEFTINGYIDKIVAYQIICHELLHLYFPILPGKYSYCHNEGLLDFISVILNYNKKDQIKLFNKLIEEYQYYKNIKSNEGMKQQNPYLLGFVLGFMLSKYEINKIINFVKLYNKERNYCLEVWKNKRYIDFIKSKNFYNKYCEQYFISS